MSKVLLGRFKNLFEEHPLRASKSGAAAVQRFSTFSSTFQQKRVDFLAFIPYYLVQSGWVIPERAEVTLPHNPPVPGSSPGCPISHMYLLNK
jgi:hypothetical protein